MKLLLRILQVWVAWVLLRPRLVIGLSLALAVISLGVTVSKLDVKTDQLELISTNHPLIPLVEKLEPFNFDGKTTFTVVIQASTPHRAVSFAKRLETGIMEDSDHFQEVFYRIDPNLFKRWALLYLDKEDILKIRDSLEANAGLIRGFAQKPDVLSFLTHINQEMASQMVGQLFTGFLGEAAGDEDDRKKSEPMDLGVLIQTLERLSAYLKGSRDYYSPWTSFFRESSWDLDLEGYFWEADKRLLIMSVVPRKQKDRFTTETYCLECLRNRIREVQASFPDVHVGVTGQEALNTDEMMTVSKDMSKATWVSLLSVLVLMVLFFRSLRRPLVEIVALGVGLCWTFGWTTVVIGHVNILSIVFAPMLCGLGVDYGIHWFARLEEEERNNCVSLATVIRRVTERSGPGIFLAGLSTAFSLLPFILTGFRGLMELGLVTGAGILIILIADFTLLPVLSVLFGGRRAGSQVCGDEPEDRDVLRLKPRGSYVILASVLLLCALSLLSARHVRFDLNPLRLQAANAEAVIWEKLLIEKSKRSPLSAAVFASSPEEVRAKSALIERLPTVSEVESLFSFVPDGQNEKIPLLRSLLPLIPIMHGDDKGTGSPSAQELIETLERIRFKMQDNQAEKWGAAKPLLEQISRVRTLAGEVVGLLQEPSTDPDGLKEYAKRFQEDLLTTWDFLRAGASASTMTAEDIPPELKSRFFNAGLYLLRIYPKESIWEEDALARFIQDLQRVDPEVVGEPVSLYVFAAAFKRACIHASVYAVVCIFLLLMVTFRSLGLALLALLPLGVGALWTVGIMGFVGVEFNLANSIFMPLVIGAGVEYGVIILNRWREGRMRPGHLPYSTSKGVILAALTTTVGFGTLMISHHRGIFSLGFVAWEGSLCVLLSALVILPAVLASMRQPVAVPDKEEMNEKNPVVIDSISRSVVAYECSAASGRDKRGYCGRYTGPE